MCAETRIVPHCHVRMYDPAVFCCQVSTLEPGPGEDKATAPRIHAPGCVGLLFAPPYALSTLSGTPPAPPFPLLSLLAATHFLLPLSSLGSHAAPPPPSLLLLFLACSPDDVMYLDEELRQAENVAAAIESRTAAHTGNPRRLPPLPHAPGTTRAHIVCTRLLLQESSSRP